MWRARGLATAAAALVVALLTAELLTAELLTANLGCDLGHSSAGPSGTPVPTVSSNAVPGASAPSSTNAPPTPTPPPTPDASPAPSYVTAAVLSGKSVGHTSVVFKLKLDGGLEAAYKPRSNRGHNRYKGEIAAYRVAIALGSSNVPMAVPRAFPLTSLQAAMGEGTPARELLDKEVTADPDGKVPGALMPWIPKLEFLALEKPEWQGRYGEWLSGDAGPPEGQSSLSPGSPDGGGAVIDAQSLAAQMSTLVVFDTLTGNWDRWSGGQIGFTSATQTLLYLDNDGAFYEDPPPGPLASQFARLAKVWRFSRSFIGALRAFEPKAAEVAVGDDGRGNPVLTKKALAGLEARRKKILAIVDAKIAERSLAAVLSLP